MSVSRIKAHYWSFLPIYHCPNPHKRMKEAGTPPFFFYKISWKGTDCQLSTYDLCWPHLRGFLARFRVSLVHSNNQRAVSYLRLVATNWADTGFQSPTSSKPTQSWNPGDLKACLIWSHIWIIPKQPQHPTMDIQPETQSSQIRARLVSLKMPCILTEPFSLWLFTICLLLSSSLVTASSTWFMLIGPPASRGSNTGAKHYDSLFTDKLGMDSAVYMVDLYWDVWSCSFQGE